MLADDLKYLLSFFILLVGLIGAAEMMRKWLRGSQEFTRKFVHMATGVLVALSVYFIHNKWPMVALGIVFALVNYFAIEHGWLKGMHHTHRRSYGTVFYPLSFVILVLLLWDHYRLVFICAILIMALADAMAAIVGENLKQPRMFHVGFDRKSVQGSVTMFLVSMLIVFIALLLADPLQNILIPLWTAAVVALFATACEMVSYQGSDNLTVPLGSALVLHYLLTHPVHDGWVFTLGMVLALVVALVSYRAQFLTISGTVAVFILGSMIFGIGRWPFSVPIMTFFILSSLLSKLGKNRKRKYAGLIEKGGARDLWQVAANGGLAGLVLLCWYVWPHPVWFLLFVASLAAVTADTWSTEIGMLSRHQPRFILNFRPVPPGTSGGITLLGTSGAFLGSAILAGVSTAFHPGGVVGVIGWREFIIILFSGLFASLFDSLLGATVQAKFHCVVCGKETEKTHHCHRATEFHSGYRWVNNDVVNILAALFGVAMVWMMNQWM
jgi:uncharacterized protein (TIGR00297 family)